MPDNESSLISCLPMALAVLDENLDLVAASRDMFSLFGIRRSSEALDGDLAELSRSMESRRDLFTLVGASSLKLRSAGSRDYFRWTEGARVFDVCVFAVPKGDEFVYGVHLNETSRALELEKQRDLTRNYLEKILDSLPLGIVVMDRQALITTMNTAQQKILRLLGKNVSLVQAVGTGAEELLGEEPALPWAKIREQVIGGGETLQWRTDELATPEGLRVFSIGIAPLRDTAGQVSGAVRIAEDVTMQVELEKKARTSELIAARFETLKQVTVTINHEVNTALTAIMSQVEIACTVGDQIPASKKPVLDSIMAQAERIADFVERLTAIKEIRTVDYLDGWNTKMLDVGPAGEPGTTAP